MGLRGNGWVWGNTETNHRLTYSRNPEGVLVAKKDFNLPKHQDIDTKNLFVCTPCVFLKPTTR